MYFVPKDVPLSSRSTTTTTAETTTTESTVSVTVAETSPVQSSTDEMEEVRAASVM